MRGVGVAQIVKAHVAKPGFGPDAGPEPLDIVYRHVRRVAGEHIRVFRVRLFPDRRQQRHGLAGQRHMLDALLFRRMGGLGPDAALHIELIPCRGHGFAAPRAGQQQQPHEIRGALVRALVQGFAEPRQFFVAKPPVALVFLKLRDAGNRVVGTPAPSHRQREHLG